MQNTGLYNYQLLQLKQIPFIEMADTYIVDEEYIDKVFNDLEEHGFRDFEELKERYKSFYVTHEQMQQYLMNNTPIAEYEALKWVRDEYALNQLYTVSTDDREFDTRTKEEETRKVLNRRNPFAKVVIEDQSFIYPQEDAHGTLTFATNHHLVKTEVRGGSTYYLKPGFKVSKSKNRSHTEHIIASDSISTRLPDENNGKTIVYI